MTQDIPASMQPPQFWPPLEAQEIEEARQVAYERLEPFILQAWDTRMDYLMHDFRELRRQEQYALLKSAEPWAVLDPVTGTTVPAPWLMEISAISSREVAKWLRLYADLIREFEPERNDLANLQGFGA